MICPFEKIFPSQLVKNHEYFMACAYNQAVEAYAENEVPVGAVIVLNNEIIASDHNRVLQLNDPSAHAEMLVISKAASVIGDWRLNETTLYVTKEPCPMCSGACIMARIGTVVYGFSDPKMGCLGGAFSLNLLPQINHRVDVITGVMGDQCHEIIQKFFKSKRENKCD